MSPMSTLSVSPPLTLGTSSQHAVFPQEAMLSTCMKVSFLHFNKIPLPALILRCLQISRHSHKKLHELMIYYFCHFHRNLSILLHESYNIRPMETFIQTKLCMDPYIHIYNIWNKSVAALVGMRGEGSQVLRTSPKAPRKFRLCKP